MGSPIELAGYDPLKLSRYPRRTGHEVYDFSWSRYGQNPGFVVR